MDNRDKYISISEIRNLDIVQVLAKMGHVPAKQSSKVAWFLSPFRSERTASFNVSLVKNLWYDFGTGEGGDVIELVKQMLDCSFKEALEYLSDQNGITTLNLPVALAELEHEGKIKIIRTLPIAKPALVHYLTLRCIPVKIASEYCKEVHYELHGNTYFSLGLQNRLGGWELRNKYFKNSTSPKSYTYIKNRGESVLVLEGMFDFLSLASLNNSLLASADCIILNSLSFVGDLDSLLPLYQEARLYLDNDIPGDKSTEKLLKQHSNTTDHRSNYSGFKDLNEKLIYDCRGKL